jgi:hypothetical protein
MFRGTSPHDRQRSSCDSDTENPAAAAAASKARSARLGDPRTIARTYNPAWFLAGSRISTLARWGSMSATSPPSHLGSQLPVTATVIAVVLVVLLMTASICTITWLALRNTKPRDRPAILRALARLVRALAAIRHADEITQATESVPVSKPGRR